MQLANLIVGVMRPGITRAVRRVLGDRFASPEVERILHRTWGSYGDLARDIAAEPTLGARVMVRLAALTVAMDAGLRETGLGVEESRAVVSEITWRIYEKLAWLPWALTRLAARRRIRRVRRAMDMFMTWFPYRAPGYRMRYVPTEGDAVGFDVQRCPVAEYFASRDQAELCVSSFCNLDYPLAEQWGVTFERSQTLAGGATFCDFRFRAKGSSGAANG